MRKAQAFQKAKKHAKRYRSDRYVIVEDRDYDHCSEFDLDTWYSGAKVIAHFDQSGSTE